VAGTVQSFQGCKRIETLPAADYRVYYSLSPAPGGGTLWRGGFSTDVSLTGGQWVGRAAAATAAAAL
jgi:hypothetical protein